MHGKRRKQARNGKVEHISLFDRTHQLINKLYATLQRADYTLGRYLPQNVLALSLEASSDTI